MTMRRDVHDELRARLHEAAGAHRPDRARILARLERGMAQEELPRSRAARPPRFGWVRAVGVTAAVAGILAAGGYGVASVVNDEPPQQTLAVPPTPAPASTSTPTPSTGATRRAPSPVDPTPVDPTPKTSREPSEPSASPSRTPDTGAPAAGEQDGPLWSDGSVDPHSNDFWAQSNVTLKTREELTALTVELRIAQTGGVTSTGAWRSLPEADFTLTITEKDGYLVHTWVLKQGRTVPAGQWMFAGQYNHARGGRDAWEDRYAATARTRSEQLAVSGDFARHDD
ncbi:hypothetical protein [Streptomyces lateritius]|uniref:hypothetical protein n=1 Tax=Streptomyces lateritius TaxID=67313 RepID=UPI001674862E|nr:hypothetical protein [Streptomyces lateritius]GGU14803.1 hypothetical protein GCM10010272_69710 [Streptomyces lateritius]